MRRKRGVCSATYTFTRPGLLTAGCLAALLACSNPTTAGREEPSADGRTAGGRTERLVLEISANTSRPSAGMLGASAVRPLVEVGDRAYWIYDFQEEAVRDKAREQLNSADGAAVASDTVEYVLFEEESDAEADADAPALADGRQYGPQLVGAPDAWDTSLGQDITVAVIDSGIDGGHPEFADNADVSDSENTRLLNGFNFVERDEDGEPAEIPAGEGSDPDGHGTHVAGVIAAAGDNGHDMAGIAWRSRLLDVRVFDETGRADSGDLAEGIVKAVDEGADVINMSFGAPVADLAIRSAVQYALEHDVVLVAASGNDGVRYFNYPAYYPGVIAVGAVDAYGRQTEFTTTGRHVALFAPGYTVFSAVPGQSDYGLKSGTSMAAPFVSGAAALLLAENDFTPTQLRKLLAEPASAEGPPILDVAGAVGLSDNPPEAPGPIEVSVKDADGQALSSAPVLLKDETGAVSVRSSETNDTGTVRFYGVPNGQYEISVLDAAYEISAGPDSESRQVSISVDDG